MSRINRVINKIAVRSLAALAAVATLSLAPVLAGTPVNNQPQQPGNVNMQQLLYGMGQTHLVATTTGTQYVTGTKVGKIAFSWNSTVTNATKVKYIVTDSPNSSVVQAVGYGPISQVTAGGSAGTFVFDFDSLPYEIGPMPYTAQTFYVRVVPIASNARLLTLPSDCVTVYFQGAPWPQQ